MLWCLRCLNASPRQYNLFSPEDLVGHKHEEQVIKTLCSLAEVALEKGDLTKDEIPSLVKMGWEIDQDLKKDESESVSVVTVQDPEELFDAKLSRWTGKAKNAAAAAEAEAEAKVASARAKKRWATAKIGVMVYQDFMHHRDTRRDLVTRIQAVARSFLARQAYDRTMARVRMTQKKFRSNQRRAEFRAVVAAEQAAAAERRRKRAQANWKRGGERAMDRLAAREQFASAVGRLVTKRRKDAQLVKQWHVVAAPSRQRGVALHRRTVREASLRKAFAVHVGAPWAGTTST